MTAESRQLEALAGLPIQGMARLACPARAVRLLLSADRRLAAMPRSERSPAAQWLSDNARMLCECAVTLRRELARAPGLPASDGVPRVLLFCRAALARERDALTQDALLACAQAWQETAAFEQGELALLYAAMRVALMEKVLSLARQAVAESRTGRRAMAFARRVAKNGALAFLPDDPLFIERLLRALTDMENMEALACVDASLRARDVDREKTVLEAHARLTRTRAQLGEAITALRACARFSWAALIEEMSRVHAILRADPVFSRMDMASRALYARNTAAIARRLSLPEETVARAAIACARENDTETGYYLLKDDTALRARLGASAKVREFSRKHGETLYCALLYAVDALALLALILLGAPFYAWLPGMLCASALARGLTTRLFLRAFPPRALPRLRLSAHAPGARTLVCVPTLLMSEKQALQMAARLSEHFLCNDTPNVDFMLLCDFADCETPARVADEDIVNACSSAVRALRETYGERFYYLHRRRAWSESERAYMGRERKRGALEMLGKLIAGQEVDDTLAYASASPGFFRERYEYVITLDADTILPPGSAQLLIGTMMHPLNAELAIVQPRMAVPASRVVTRAQRLLGGAGGVCLYGGAAGDLYQDVFGRGSYVGKGIYRPKALLARTHGRVQSERVLSHDLLEGELSSCAVAGDIVLYDGHPKHLAGFIKRLHRWTRGDWQLLPYLADRRMSPLSRHKILDNLTRSMLPAAQLSLLLAAAFSGSGWLLALAALPSLRVRGLLSALCDLALVPVYAAVETDAATRACFRLFVSGRGLLSWVTAAQAEDGGKAPPLYCTLASVLAGAALCALSLAPAPGLAFGVLYLLAPLLYGTLNAQIERKCPIPPADGAFLLSAARGTWRFFERTVTEQTHYLPPDNLQIEPDKGIAARTSPTNIGLYLLSCIAARELGFLDADEAARRIADTVSTLETLETWHGQLYNWYDTGTLSPLSPRFVSSVDSGNFAACLLLCAQALRARSGEVDLAVRALPARLDAMLSGMELSALYDKRDRLFSVGCEPERDALSGARYDLLASESRLLSFMAVIGGQAPVKHWFTLGRNQTRVCGGQALLSWGGTMFEYLLPALLMPTIRGTLLWQTCRQAVRAQIAYARKGRPWGVSESGYALLDPQLNYQYRAFGVPALSMAGDTEGCVVAPYASALALPIRRKRATDNLLRMKALGWYDEMGFYEAADYARARSGSSPQLVLSHMAHHQGMILCAILNALRDDYLVQTFAAMPRVRAYQLLLEEPACRRAYRLPRLRASAPEDGAPATLARCAHQGFPMDAHALFGAGTTLLLSAQGQGYLSRDGVLLSRFSPEAGAQTGMQVYIRDCASGAFFRPTDGGACAFAPEHARFDALQSGLRACLTCFVSPLSGAAVHALEITELSRRAREIEVASFMELALGGAGEDAAQPAFRNLFVRVDALAHSALLALRRADGKDKKPLFAVHFLRADAQAKALALNGDRMAFIGRAGTMREPQALVSGDVPRALGAVIEPCVNLRARFSVPPGGRLTVCFVTALVASEDAAHALLRAFPEVAPVLAELPLAKVRAQMAARYLGMDAAKLALAQRMTGCVLFSGQPHQAQNALAGREGLWRLGISGDLPVVALAIAKREEMPVAQQVLLAHAWWRLSGVWVDLAIIHSEEAGYAKPLRDELLALLPPGIAGIPGGVHIIEASDEEGVRTLRACARLYLTGEPLRGQLAVLRGTAGAPKPGQSTRAEVETAPSGEGLAEFNGIGGFLPDSGYCVRLAKGSAAPAPWCNILCGAVFGTLCTEQGILYSYYQNSRLGRLTAHCPDAVVTLPSEEYLLREENALRSLTPRPLSSGEYEISHAPGATEYRARLPGLQCELAVSSAPDCPAGERRITLRNLSGADRNMELLVAVRFAMGEMPLCTRVEAERDTLFARDAGMPGVAFAHLPGAKGVAMTHGEYRGLSGAREPEGLAADELPSGGGSVGVLALPILLRAGESATFHVTLGYVQDASAARQCASARVPSERDARSAWARRLSGLLVFSPERALDRAMNVWLPYQTRASRLQMRAGFYQSGGAVGFRDQLQDMLALLHTEPGRVREHLLVCARHQFLEGDVQHWWHEPRMGVRTNISDDLLFLPYVTAQYVRVSGDRGILESRVPYLLAPELAPGERDRFFAPEETDFAESLHAHCMRAIRRVRFGEHGLPLMGGGDWNDGMNAVGGESVWLCFFFVCVLKDYEPLCAPEEALELRRMYGRLLDASQCAWTGRWYLRAWYESGETLGAPDSKPPRIDLITQCYAVLAGAPRSQALRALSEAWDMLYDEASGTLKLLSPPFAPEEGAGYIAGYLPGVRENGGQYTHAVPWMIRALLRAGERERAFTLARMALPGARSDTPEKMLRYRVEPYVLAADIYTADGQEGRGGWTWYTGSAAWLYYVLLTDILGFEKFGARVRLCPRVPEDFHEFTICYRYGESEYQLTAVRGAHFPTLDGELLEDGFATLRDDGRTHEARFSI